MRVTVSVSIDVFNVFDTPEKILQKLKEKLSGGEGYRPVFIGEDGEMNRKCAHWSNSVQFELKMDIKVRLFGQDIPLTVGADQTVGELKSQINQLKTIDPLFQTLTFDDRELDLDDAALSFYKIKPGSIVQLVLNSKYVVFVQGIQTPISVEPNLTIGELKKTISTLEGDTLMKKEIKLYCNGWLSDESKSIKHYSIKHNSFSS